MFDDNVLFAFLMTLFAGLSTGIGSAMAFFTKRTNVKLLSFTLGFSAGVMICVSLIEIFPEAVSLIEEGGFAAQAEIYTTLAFFAGMLLVFIIDMLIPDVENPHHLHGVGDVEETLNSSALRRVGIMTAIALAIHNFPEGIATFASSLVLPEVGIPIAVAIAIHNIPEGMAVSIPMYHATGSRKKAFWLSFASGLAEPLGAIFSFLILRQFLNNFILGIVMAAVAGIMVYISVDELLPAAQRFGKAHHAIVGFMIGMAVMAASLILFGMIGL